MGAIAGEPTSAGTMGLVRSGTFQRWPARRAGGSIDDGRPSPVLSEPCPLHRALLALVVAMLLGVALPATPVAAASGAKVVVVVGPVGDHTAHYKADANDIVAEAKRYTSNVVKLFTPNATWAKVKAAAQDASIFVYLGHG